MLQTQRLLSPAYRTTFVVSAIFFAAGFSLASQSPSIPALATQLHVNPAELGGIFSTFSIGVIAVQFLLEPLSQRFSTRNILMTCVLLMGLSFLLIAQGINLLLLFGAALFSGFGFGGIISLGNRTVASLFPRGSAAALNGINVFFGIGSIMGPALASVFSKQFNTPQYALSMGGLMLCCFGALVLVSVPTTAAQPDAPAQTQTERASPTFTPNVWLLGLLMLIYTGTEIGFSAWITLYMLESTTLPVASAALVSAGFWMALTGGRLLATLLGMRITAQQLMLLSIGGLVLSSIILISSVGNLPISILGVLLFGLSCGPMFPTGIALVAASARATGRLMVITNCGGLLLPALFGVVLSSQGPLTMQLLIGFTTLIMLGVGIITLRPATRA